ncbi:hypothetical protein ACFSTC_12925 [Nonomuraea ferruginea]
MIDRLAGALELSPEALEVTWRSLREHGNLSSVSVLHVLQETRGRKDQLGRAAGARAGLLRRTAPAALVIRTASTPGSAPAPPAACPGRRRSAARSPCTGARPGPAS